MGSGPKKETEEEIAMKRTSKLSLVLVLTMVLAMLVSFSVQPAQAAKNYKLQIQTAVPNASVYFKLMERMAKRVDAMSAGRLKIKVLPAGAVVPVFEILDAVDKGIVNGGFAWTHYWSGKHPAGLLFSAPTAGLGFGLDQLSTMSFMYDGGGNELYQEYFTKILGYNIRGFMCMPMGPEPFGWFKKPFKNLAELKEMKFRSPPASPPSPSRPSASPPSPCPAARSFPRPSAA
jgi:TRAP-type mannitol/chloroaromatic compound transport system substrate-binding protein